jgi:hypothetical protein
MQERTLGTLAKSLTWLAFNIGVQAIPVGYLWIHRHDQNPAFWEYLNCTLAIMAALGMMAAGISDMITEGATTILHKDGWFMLGVCVILSLIALQRTVYDEFVKREQAEFEVTIPSALLAASLIATGTFLKAKIWLDQESPES